VREAALVEGILVVVVVASGRIVQFAARLHVKTKAISISSPPLQPWA
jgi:hypothetical protein